MSERITSSETESVQRPSLKKPEKKGRSIPVKAIALLVGGATLVGGVVIADKKIDNRNEKVNKYQKTEADTLEASRISGSLAVLEALVVMRDVNIRETPDAINGRFTVPVTGHDILRGNVSSTVGSDEQLVVRQPILLTKPDGSSWLGFRIQGPEILEGDYVSSPQVAKDIDWINYSQLLEATDSDGEKLVQAFPLGGKSEVTAKMLPMSEQGQILDGKRVGARAELFEGNTVQRLMELQATS